MFTKKKSNSNLFEISQNITSNHDSTLQNEKSNRNEKIFSCLKMGADVNAGLDNGNTILHEIMQNDTFDIEDHALIKILVMTYKADINKVNNDKQTPFSILLKNDCIKNHMKIQEIDFLLKMGAKVFDLDANAQINFLMIILNHKDTFKKYNPYFLPLLKIVFYNNENVDKSILRASLKIHIDRLSKKIDKLSMKITQLEHLDNSIEVQKRYNDYVDNNFLIETGKDLITDIKISKIEKQSFLETKEFVQLNEAHDLIQRKLKELKSINYLINNEIKWMNLYIEAFNPIYNIPFCEYRNPHRSSQATLFFQQKRPTFNLNLDDEIKLNKEKLSLEDRCTLIDNLWKLQLRQLSEKNSHRIKIIQNNIYLIENALKKTDKQMRSNKRAYKIIIESLLLLPLHPNPPWPMERKINPGNYYSILTCYCKMDKSSQRQLAPYIADAIYGLYKRNQSIAEYVYSKSYLFKNQEYIRLGIENGYMKAVQDKLEENIIEQDIEEEYKSELMLYSMKYKNYL